MPPHYKKLPTDLRKTGVSVDDHFSFKLELRVTVSQAIFLQYFTFVFQGFIRLTAVAAKNLKKADVAFMKKGLSDPYCKICGQLILTNATFELIFVYSHCNSSIVLCSRG